MAGKPTVVARTLRKRLTDAESLLWQGLRKRQIEGCKFRRQHPLGRFVVDFVNLERGLVIELDGGQHAEDERSDKRRDMWLKSQGFKVLRFWNNEVFENLDGVLELIRTKLHNVPNAGQSPPPGLPPQGGGIKGHLPHQGGENQVVPHQGGENQVVPHQGGENQGEGRSRFGGFTLVELIIAVTLMAVIAMSIGEIFRQSLASKKVVSASSLYRYALRVIQDEMFTTLKGCYQIESDSTATVLHFTYLPGDEWRYEVTAGKLQKSHFVSGAWSPKPVTGAENISQMTFSNFSGGNFVTVDYLLQATGLPSLRSRIQVKVR